MRTIEPIPATISGTIWTDESIDLPIEIDYEYARITDLFGAFCIAVTINGYTVLGQTTTPKEIIDPQVEQIIRDEHRRDGLQVDFNYY